MISRFVLVVLLGGAGPLAAQQRTHPRGEVLRNIPSTGQVYGVTIDRHDVVYASKVASNEILRVAFEDRNPPETATIGFQPPHLAVDADGASIFATLQGGRAVVRIASRTGATIDSVPLGGDGFNLALDPDGEHLIATAGHGWAYRLRRDPLAITDSIYVGTAPNGVVFSPDGRRAYVTSRDAGSVTVIDDRSFRVLARWVPGGALQRITITPNGRTLFVADESARGGLVRLDTRTGRFRRYAVDGTPYGLGITPDGRRLWVLLLDQGAVAIYALPSLHLVRTVTIGGRPRNLAFTARGDGAAVTTESALVLLR